MQEEFEGSIKTGDFSYDYRLRLLLTSECFFRCIYCHKEGQKEHYPQELHANDYAFLYEAFNAEFISNRVALSGGEPLSRSDIVVITKELYKREARSTLITNGVLLGTPRQPLDYISKLHIGLDVTDKDLFRKLCGRDTYSLVCANITRARNKRPDLLIKINTVLINGINDGEQIVRDLVDFACDNDAKNCFIENMTSRNNPEFIDIDEFERFLIDIGFELTSKTPLKTILGYKDRKQQVELIRCFCPTAEKTGKPSSFCNKYNNTFFVNPDGSINSCFIETRLTNVADLILARDMDRLRIRLRLIMDTMGNNCPLAERIL